MNPALFRPGTSDRAIWENVVTHNEYRLPDRFDPHDVILDIGGNSGSFSHACIKRGAGRVIAFEPDPDNFILFRKQLKAEIRDGRVEVYNVAVVGGSGFEWRTFSGVVKKDGEVNHGGAYTFNRDGSDPFGYGEFFVGRPFQVPSLGIHDVLTKWPSPRLMKLDCEGAEFEILESMFRDTPAEIVGEYHPQKGSTVDDLISDLGMAGYAYKIQPHENSELGLFWATRK